MHTDSSATLDSGPADTSAGAGAGAAAQGASAAAPALAIHDCWNRIGVAGDQSCARLAEVVHCRNCDVYASAAQRNLQRAVGADYQRDWANHFRNSDADGGAAAAALADTSALVFRIGREWLALPTKIFASVAPQAAPHVLPHRGGRGLLGVVNVGGKLYPCMSLADLLGIDDSEAQHHHGRHTFARLLVMQWEEQAFALPVADLYGIVRYAGSAMKAPAATINKGLSRFLSGVVTHQPAQVGKAAPQADMQIGCLDAALIGYQLARNLR